jgi:hypothetical protein
MTGRAFCRLWCAPGAWRERHCRNTRGRALPPMPKRAQPVPRLCTSTAKAGEDMGEGAE